MKTSLFNLMGTLGNNSILIEQTTFINFINPFMTSLFLTSDSNPSVPTIFNITLVEVTFSNIFFDQGIFFHDQGFNSELFAYIFTVIGGTLTNYNP
jgi:hypothetical protein